MKVLACAIGFGLGPGGKLCSVVENNPQYEWYACGDEIDLSIYQHNPFRDTCRSKSRKDLSRFVEENGIHCAVNVLDPELAVTLKELGLTVIYIDSIPFVWTEADLIPQNMDYYCAQKYPGYPGEGVLRKVQNLIWVDPIVCRYTPAPRTSQIVVNFGGLHSPFGEGEEYYLIVMKALLSVFDRNQIRLTGGKNVVKLTERYYPELHCQTYSHEAFLQLVSSSALFITSPGLTTIYETCGMDIRTVILPPQNLSQFYNADIAEKLCRKVCRLSWDTDALSKESLNRFQNSLEEASVNYIYEQIRILSEDAAYRERYPVYVHDSLEKGFTINQTELFSSNGVEEISLLLEQIRRST